MPGMLFSSLPTLPGMVFFHGVESLAAIAGHALGLSHHAVALRLGSCAVPGCVSIPGSIQPWCCAGAAPCPVPSQQLPCCTAVAAELVGSSSGERGRAETQGLIRGTSLCLDGLGGLHRSNSRAGWRRNCEKLPLLRGFLGAANPFAGSSDPPQTRRVHGVGTMGFTSRYEGLEGTSSSEGSVGSNLSGS